MSCQQTTDFGWGEVHEVGCVGDTVEEFLTVHTCAGGGLVGGGDDPAQVFADLCRELGGAESVSIGRAFSTTGGRRTACSRIKETARSRSSSGKTVISSSLRASATL
ncbi:hypothetical protein AB0P36_31240 [Streptomyces flavidovirens]|uniref:hypothetical protein n=1 Tax=Streptomyces flavidovirens TaxID=67298 RepID=UPI003421916F